MTAPQLIAQVQAALGLLSAVYTSHANESDLYEAALFACARNALVGAGATVEVEVNGRPSAAPLHFRASPGNLWLGSFSYLRATFPGSKSLELHLGAKVVGASGVAHECDVALIDGPECDRSRQVGAHPRRTKVIAALEAKFYASSPGIGIGRGFLGLSQEIGGPKCFLVFPSTASANVQTLIARKEPECFPLVQLGTVHATRLQGLLEQKVRNWVAKP